MRERCSIFFYRSFARCPIHLFNHWYNNHYIYYYYSDPGCLPFVKYALTGSGYLILWSNIRSKNPKINFIGRFIDLWCCLFCIRQKKSSAHKLTYVRLIGVAFSILFKLASISLFSKASSSLKALSFFKFPPAALNLQNSTDKKYDWFDMKVH